MRSATWLIPAVMVVTPAWLAAQTIDRHGAPSVACNADGMKASRTHRTYGPRTRREFLKLLAHERA